MDKVDKVDLSKKRPTEAAPKLNQARCCHGSTLIDTILYVYGGTTQKIVHLASLEKLNLAEEGSKWELFTVPGLNARNSPIFCKLDGNKVLVAGG